MIDLDLALIVRDAEIQPREMMDVETITQYAEDMLAGVEFPPVVAYHDGDRYWLSQGFHRCHAAEQAGFDTIAADVRQGTRQDALWDAAGSNREHDQAGLRRSNADKRRAVTMALEAKPKLSDRAIADRVGVDGKTVASVRARCGNSASDIRIGTDGKSYPTTNGRLKTIVDYELFDDQPEPPDLFQLTPPPAIATEVKPAAKPTFNATNEMVDWARWTWNPVTGCEHTCVYCYARDIANRFYPEKFTPTYRPERLEAPRHTTMPAAAREETDPVKTMGWRNCFVCSMADLFGRWVPQEWIDGVFESCRQSPEWNYLFLTKFPQRYIGLNFPDTSWVGTTVDEQKRVANAEKAFRKIDVPVKWLSVEPMLEPLKFDDLSMFDWVVIGGQSRSSGAPEFHPEPWWVIDLAHAARDAGCKVYMKPNTFSYEGWQIKEYPY